ncbi:MAG: nitroreductase family protein [Halanaerobiales bacterium]
MNSTLKTIEDRVSLRRYKDKKIDDQELEQIIKSAMRAPTAGNMMLYSILVIKDKEKKKILSKTCDNQPFIAKAPVVLVFLADFQRLFDYFKVSNLQEYCEREDKDYPNPKFANMFLAAGDTFIAAQNAVIAAESMGIGSCYIGDIIENYEIKKSLLNLPKYTLPLTMLILGYYPDGYKKRKSKRFEKDYIVFEEEYKRLSEKALKEMYNEKEEKISKNNRYNADNYGQYIYAHKFDTEFLKEMERSLNVMIKEWLNNQSKI